jgi:hypothetical protein
MLAKIIERAAALKAGDGTGPRTSAGEDSGKSAAKASPAVGEERGRKAAARPAKAKAARREAGAAYCLLPTAYCLLPTAC